MNQVLLQVRNQRSWQSHLWEECYQAWYPYEQCPFPTNNSIHQWAAWWKTSLRLHHAQTYADQYNSSKSLNDKRSLPIRTILQKQINIFFGLLRVFKANYILMFKGLQHLELLTNTRYDIVRILIWRFHQLLVYRLTCIHCLLFLVTVCLVRLCKWSWTLLLPKYLPNN